MGRSNSFFRHRQLIQRTDAKQFVSVRQGSAVRKEVTNERTRSSVRSGFGCGMTSEQGRMLHVGRIRAQRPFQYHQRRWRMDAEPMEEWEKSLRRERDSTPRRHGPSKTGPFLRCGMANTSQESNGCEDHSFMTNSSWSDGQQARVWSDGC